MFLAAWSKLHEAEYDVLMVDWSPLAQGLSTCHSCLFSPFFLQNSSSFVFSQVSGTSPMPITMKLHTMLWMSEGEKRQFHHLFFIARLFCVYFVSITLLFFHFFADTWDSVWPTLPTREFSASMINDYIPCYFDSSKFSSKSFSLPFILLNRGKLDVLHLVGHSLGAHAMGKVSKINFRHRK